MRSLLLSLFLYFALIWVWALSQYEGPEIQEFGFRWTIVGLVVALAFIASSRLLGWWHLWRAKRSVRQAAPPKPVKIVHEDDAALDSLIAEANASLAKAPAYAGAGRTPLTELPWYLLIGPEGSGKTSTFLNSGLEPVLLAGQVAGSAPVVSTKLCNLWLARNAIFVEISGRAFGGDMSRWTQLLRVLRGQSQVPLWRRLWGEPEPGLALQGVVAFCDVKEFTGASNEQLSERNCRLWQERLRAIGEVFAVDFPVYQVITKCDAIPFFSDYFRRLREPEANQILGSTLPLHEAEVAIEAEIKRLTRSFSPLYQALAKRHIKHLAHEPDLTRRPGVYEFLRELKRIRSPLIQFLSDVFRPHPLQPGPLLRGYYLTGVREVESAAPDLGASRSDWSGTIVGLPSAESRADATRIFSVSGGSSGSVGPGSRRGSLMRWMFVSDLFHTVILADRPARKAAPVDARMEQYRRGVYATVCGVCALLCCAFLWSWMGNRELLHRIQAGEGFSRKGDKLGIVNELRSLEGLRADLQQLTDYDRNGAPWSLRWGLYSGSRVLAATRETYFRRFQQLLLNDLNGAIVASLAAAPGVSGPGNPHDRVYRLLRTHLTVSSGACRAEPAYVARVLKEVREEIPQLAGSELQALSERQIDFFASELPFGNPCRLSEDSAARDRARQFLFKNTGVEALYKGILASAEKTLTKPQRLGDLAANHTQVLSGSGEVGAVFSREGWNVIEKASKVSTGAVGEACVIGDKLGLLGERKQDAETQRAIQRLYVRDYVGRWRKFLAGFSVLRYSSADDAARKLDILAAHKSPLLALFAMTADQTDFPPMTPEPDAIDKAAAAAKKLFPALKRAEKELKNKGLGDSASPSAPDPLTNPADITRSFQPVHWVVPPGSEKWVAEKNSPYIESLAQLGHSMQDIARGGTNPDPAVHQAASQNYDKALDAVRQIAKGFKPLGVEGLDGEVKRLLEEPILRAKAFIISDMDESVVRKLNNELRSLCTPLRITLRKYPFQPLGEDLSLAELTKWFAPGGEIWQFQAKSLAELTAKDGSQWKAKDPAKKPQVTPAVLSFLTRAQSITDAFFAAGATHPSLAYTLRPKLEPSFGDSSLELEVDGQLHQWTTRVQKQFVWPAPPGTKNLGAIARIRGSFAYPFANRSGGWGIFRIMGEAEPRQLGTALVEWKYSHVGDGRPDPIQPAPVRLEIVGFPGGADLFNSKFFEGFQCPQTAVQ